MIENSGFTGGYVGSSNVTALYLGNEQVWGQVLELSTMVITILEDDVEHIVVKDDGDYIVAELSLDGEGGIQDAYEPDKNNNTATGSISTAASPYVVWTITGYFTGVYTIERNGDQMGSISFNGRTSEEDVTINPEPQSDYTAAVNGVWCSGDTTGQSKIGLGITPTFPDTTIVFKGHFLQRSDYYFGTNYKRSGIIIHNNYTTTGSQFSVTNITKENVYGNNTNAYIRWKAGKRASDEYVFEDYTGFGNDVDWTISYEGIYDNVAQQWVNHHNPNYRYYNNTTPFQIAFGAAIIKEIKITNDNNVVFDGVAMTRNSDGQGGLYDSVSDNFYTNDNYSITAV